MAEVKKEVEAKEVEKKYLPKWKYKHAPEHPKKYEGKVVHSEEQEKALGSDWHDSPADFGVETHPSKDGHDEEIAKKSHKHSAVGAEPKKKAEK